MSRDLRSNRYLATLWRPAVLSLVLSGVFLTARGEDFNSLEWWEAYQKAPHTNGCSQRIVYLDKAIQEKSEPALEASATNGPEIRGYFPYLQMALAFLECGNDGQALEMVETAMAKGGRIRQQLRRLEDSRRTKSKERLYLLARNREIQLGRLRAQLQVKHQLVTVEPPVEPPVTTPGEPQVESQGAPPPTTPAPDFPEVELQPMEPVTPRPGPRPAPVPAPTLPLKDSIEQPQLSEPTEDAPSLPPPQESPPPPVNRPATERPGTVNRPPVLSPPRQLPTPKKVRPDLSVQLQIGEKLRVDCAGDCTFRPAEGALEIAGDTWLLPRGYPRIVVNKEEFSFPDRQDLSYDGDLAAMESLMAGEKQGWLHLTFGREDGSSDQRRQALSAIPAVWTAGALMFPTMGRPGLYQAARESKVNEIAALKTVDFTSSKAELLVDLARLKPSPDVR